MKLKKDFFYLAVIIIAFGLCAQFYYSYHYQPAHEISIYYNQDHALNKEVISLIQNADRFAYFGIYTFTRQDIKDALLGAKYRGLDVRGVTDGRQLVSAAGQNKLIAELRDHGIPVAVQDHSGIMHLKVIVTDKGYASGSYNWTTSATDINDEVLEVGRDEGVRGQYENILKELFQKYPD